MKESSQTNNINLNLNDILFMFQVNNGISSDLEYKIKGHLIFNSSYSKNISIEKMFIKTKYGYKI